MLDTLAVLSPRGWHSSPWCPRPTHWSPQPDTGSLPKWDNGNYRTLTTFPFISNFKHTHLRQICFIDVQNIFSKSRAKVRNQFVKLEISISEDFHLFVVSEFELNSCFSMRRDSRASPTFTVRLILIPGTGLISLKGFLPPFSGSHLWLHGGSWGWRSGVRRPSLSSNK